MDNISTENNETLIEKAIENELPISFRYWRDEDLAAPLGDPPPRRTVSPYEIKEGKDGKTNLICWSHGSEGVRAFNIERIGSIQSESTDEEYVYPVERG